MLILNLLVIKLTFCTWHVWWTKSFIKTRWRVYLKPASTIFDTRVHDTHSIRLVREPLSEYSNYCVRHSLTRAVVRLFSFLCHTRISWAGLFSTTAPGNWSGAPLSPKSYLSRVHFYNMCVCVWVWVYLLTFAHARIKLLNIRRGSRVQHTQAT